MYCYFYKCTIFRLSDTDTTTSANGMENINKLLTSRKAI